MLEIYSLNVALTLPYYFKTSNDLIDAKAKITTNYILLNYNYSIQVEEKPVVDLEDPRPQPEYDLNFSQNVSSEDMFLQMGYKNPSTACADNLILRIWLDVSSAKDIELDVRPDVVDCRTKSHRLTLSLPHPIDDQRGKAKFDIDTGILSLTLPLNREYEFLHQSWIDFTLL